MYFEEEVAYESIKRPIKQKEVISARELTLFCTGSPAAIQALKKELRRRRAKVQSLNESFQRLCNSIRRKESSIKKQDGAIAYYRVYLDFATYCQNQYIEPFSKALRILTTRNKSTLDVERARQVPIDSLIEFNRANFAKCLWHSERTPSMKYYPKDNRVYCFGCNKRGDVIDVMMSITNSSFKEAVQKLS